MGGATIRKRKVYEEFLEKVTLLSSLDKWERLSVADALETCTFKAGDVIMKEGDAGDDFYIIEEGSADVTITGEDGNAQTVNTLKEADYFGELALLEEGGKRHATVTATADCRLAKLDRERSSVCLARAMRFLSGTQTTTRHLSKSKRTVLSSFTFYFCLFLWVACFNNINQRKAKIRFKKNTESPFPRLSFSSLRRKQEIKPPQKYLQQQTSKTNVYFVDISFFFLLSNASFFLLFPFILSPTNTTQFS